MESVDKKRMLVSMCVGGLIALAALLPLGGVLCGALNRGGAPFPWVSPHLAGLTGSAPLALSLIHISLMAASSAGNTAPP